MSPSIPNLKAKLGEIFPRNKVTDAQAEAVMQFFIKAYDERDRATAAFVAAAYAEARANTLQAARTITKADIARKAATTLTDAMGQCSHVTANSTHITTSFDGEKAKAAIDDAGEKIDAAVAAHPAIIQLDEAGARRVINEQFAKAKAEGRDGFIPMPSHYRFPMGITPELTYRPTLFERLKARLYKLVGAL